mmetsp:Transcript_68981/g.138714  ORF Transcript_68981/g.138714 Transcript_68981/m.138714 type:complete len:227 (-) Transcript_68981:237-917(-)
MSPVNSRSPPPLPPPPLTAPKVLARGALNRVDCRPSKSLRNSGRSSRHGTKSTCCSFASSCNGRTRVTVFLWWKKVVMARRMPFRSTVDESNPGCGLSAVSKYSSGVMASPSSSLRSSAKSRTTHTKEGKNRRSSPAAAAAATPCSSPLPLPLLLLLLLPAWPLSLALSGDGERARWGDDDDGDGDDGCCDDGDGGCEEVRRMFLASWATKLKLAMAFSSMVPKLL